MDGFAELVKPNHPVGCVSARDQLALHVVPSRRGLTLVAPVDEIAVDEADVPGERTEPRVVEGGCVVGVGHEHDRDSSQSIHVLEVLAHLSEHDRGRRVVGIHKTPRGCMINVSDEVDDDNQVRGLRPGETGGTFFHRRTNVWSTGL